MRKQTVTLISSLMLTGLFLSTPAQAEIRPLGKDLTQSRTLDLCGNYYNNPNEKQKKAIVKELERRAQLGFKDYKDVKKHQIQHHHIEKGMTTCGMYMANGKPLKEGVRQIRPFVYKAVHVYPKHYVVTQTGMVVDVMERKKGSLPPKLIHQAPKVQPAPMIMDAPGGQAHHQPAQTQK
ncbi:hypothetical protein [Galenea microaerophila]